MLTVTLDSDFLQGDTFLLEIFLNFFRNMIARLSILLEASVKKLNCDLESPISLGWGLRIE